MPQPGYAQLGANAILAGVATQPAEEVDFNIVDAVRNDLVRINADLFAFNVARGRDVGLGTLNQIRADLKASSRPLRPRGRGLRGQPRPLHVLGGLPGPQRAERYGHRPVQAGLPGSRPRDRFGTGGLRGGEPGHHLHDGPNGAKIVSGIDRVDLWVGGLAETHINGGMVGQTFWVVLHEQFDRLQEGDRFYYLERFDNFDFYQNIVDGQNFTDIVARNTGLTDCRRTSSPSATRTRRPAAEPESTRARATAAPLATTTTAMMTAATTRPRVMAPDRVPTEVRPAEGTTTTPRPATGPAAERRQGIHPAER